MATYVIGDVQGCFDELQRLLKKLRFDPAADRLWFTGDLVNRGPKSLEVLRFVRDLGERAVTVLGNHDLHMLAARVGGRLRRKDTFGDVLAAPDADALLGWLRRRPLVHAEGGWLLVHAGLPPQWSAGEAVEIGAEAAEVLAGSRGDAFLASHMYGDRPDRWAASLRGRERLRFVINCCTRMRVCAADGRVDLDYKGPADRAPPGLLPWFAVPGRRSAGATVLFGHWSALGRVHWPGHRVYGLDTGCVWGRELTALRLDDGRLFSVRSRFHGSD
jgi:bis(5'-nucleosyl)-tetraphosphatase (symmetrical)